MKHFKILALFYALTLALFAAGKVAFIFAQEAGIRGAMTAADVADVLWHGLPLDLATAGYATAPLWLLLGIGLWLNIRPMRLIYKVYVGLLAVIMALIFVGDTCLYGFWGIKLDGTVWTYLDNPTGALLSLIHI